MVESVGSRRRPRAARSAPVPVAPTAPTAETLLLALAREVSARSATIVVAADVHAAVTALAAAYEPDAPLAIALRADWIARRGDKTAELALAWAREQVRVAMVELLQHARAARVVRADGDVETLGWLWLAACEALAHEPASAVPDRVHALTAFLTTA
jgi:hypothetical protein